MKVITGDIMGCFFFLIVGSWFFINSLFLTGGQETADVGPSVFPILSAVGIIIVSIYCIARILIKKVVKLNTERIVINNRNIVAISMGTIIAYIFVMQFAGFYISSIIFIPLFLCVAGVRNIVKILSVSAGFILFICVAFDLLLGVPLP